MDAHLPEALDAPSRTEQLPADAPVSIVLCVLNEQRHLEQAVRHALDQDHAGQLQMVIALGPSKDHTDQVASRLAAMDSRITLVRNPDPHGSTPAGLNAAIAETKHPVVVRIDGHSMLPRDYVRIAVETMRETGADNVGGVMAAEGETPFEQAVARAMTSKLGVGNAAFHTGGSPGEADTVYLGVFRRSALERVGGYDETFLRAQDWEMNLRIRRTGGRVWFQPKLRVSYRPRSTVKALGRQYFFYGRWRRVVMRRHEGTVNFRYLAPPVALAGVVGGLGLAAAGVKAGAVLPAGYLVAICAGAAFEGRGLPPGAWVRLPVVTATMHLTWGAGFILSPRKLAEEPSRIGGITLPDPSAS